jgi:GntR family transcriptional regulator/MocR family aminotransferase
VGSTARLPQLALAELITTGALDRHVRRARSTYGRRREFAVEALARELPGAVVSGAPVGLFVHVSLPADEDAVLAEARRRRIVVAGVNENALAPRPPALAVGFAAEPEARFRRAVRELAAAAAGR